MNLNASTAFIYIYKRNILMKCSKLYCNLVSGEQNEFFFFNINMYNKNERSGERIVVRMELFCNF